MCLRGHSWREDKPSWARFSDQFWNHTQTLSPALHRPIQSCLLNQRGQPWAPYGAHSGSHSLAAAPACILLLLCARSCAGRRGPSGCTETDNCSAAGQGWGQGQRGRLAERNKPAQDPHFQVLGRREGEPVRARLSREAISEVIPARTT